MQYDREDIVELMEKLNKDDFLKFTLPEIFGGGVAAVGLNPDKGGKKYILKVGKDEAGALNGSIYWQNDKANPIAKWVADRLGDKIE
jgi:hypothetical protein